MYLRKGKLSRCCGENVRWRKIPQENTILEFSKEICHNYNDLMYEPFFYHVTLLKRLILFPIFILVRLYCSNRVHVEFYV